MSAGEEEDGVECGVWSVGSHSVLGTDPGQLCHNTPSVSLPPLLRRD